MTILLLSACGGPEIRLPPLPLPPEEEPAHDSNRIDRDGDGFAGSDDCGPLDPLRHPGAPERCNGLDDDCDGDSDLDQDQDGHPWCAECADEYPDFHPGAVDPLGDDLDQDCDGTDGVGTLLTAPALGTVTWGSFGRALAAADFDADGCDDLLIGQPADATSVFQVEDSVTLQPGCSGSTSIRFGIRDNLGSHVGLRPGRLLAHEYFQVQAGRVFLFDRTFPADPQLEIVGGNKSGITSATLLGESGEWILIGSQGSPYGDADAAFYLVDSTRAGLIDLQDDSPDLVVTTDDDDPSTGWDVGDVGDRDGDGSVDLAIGSPTVGNAAYFFPQVTGGHLTDAPEVWHGAGADDGTGIHLEGRSDLDGDGLEDALVSALLGEGTWVGAGRVYLAPWYGPGDRWLETEAPARVEGEFPYEATGRATAAADLDGDGQDDLVVGAPGNYNVIAFPGRVSVFLGPLEGVLTRDEADRIWVGAALGDYAGFSLATGDFDGSGHADIAIGAPFVDSSDGEDVGAVYLLMDPF